MSRPSEAFYFRLHHSKFLSATRTLSKSEVGLLTLLMAMMSERGEPLVVNGMLYRGCNSTKSAFDREIARLAECGLISRLGDGRLWCGWISDEIDFRERKSSNGERAAKKRWENSQQNQASVDADAMPDKDIDRRGDARRGRHPNSKDRSRDHKAASSAPEGAPGVTVVFRSGDNCSDFMRTIDHNAPICFASEAAKEELVEYIASRALRRGADKEECGNFQRVIRELAKRKQLTRGQAEEELHRFTHKAGEQNAKQA
ncbi:YdaU family protein [Rhizobium ruizarguesonis]|uniref:YdaU family protein n=1 Tax=Rhizobium ruizarguesonis TaxID=2081791 RepID=UPI0013EEA480|nr:YdaU family protein [Rhizobium ruizarguesonis]